MLILQLRRSGYDAGVAIVLRKINLFCAIALFTVGCDTRTVVYRTPHHSKTTVVETVYVEPEPQPTTIIYESPTPTTVVYQTCNSPDPLYEPHLNYSYCSHWEGPDCVCEVYYNSYTGCDEEWCYWHDACGWEYEQPVWCY